MGPFTVEDEPPAKRIGRPSEYTLERGAYICAELDKGRSLLSILREEGQPDRMTLVRWLAANDAFHAGYARARRRLGRFRRKTRRAVDDVPPEYAQSRKLAIDTGKWLLSKLAARRHGDRIEVKNDISGPGCGPLQVDVLVNTLLTPTNLERLTDVEVEFIRSAAVKLCFACACY